MLIGKVVGSIVSTRKNEKLVGNKLMIVKVNEQQLVAIDNIGAGIDELVLVVRGSAARLACANKEAPVDAAIVGIVDEGTGLE